MVDSLPSKEKSHVFGDDALMREILSGKDYVGNASQCKH